MTASAPREDLIIVGIDFGTTWDIYEAFTLKN